MSGKWTVVAIVDRDTDRITAWSVEHENEWRTRQWWVDNIPIRAPRFPTRAEAQREADRLNNADEYNATKTEAKP